MIDDKEITPFEAMQFCSGNYGKGWLVFYDNVSSSTVSYPLSSDNAIGLQLVQLAVTLGLTIQLKKEIAE